MYQEALRDRPDDGIRLRLAFALLRAGDGSGAQRTAREVLAREPDSRSSEAEQTLRRFLAVAPAHPAAAEIKRLLAAGQSTGR
ncbi:hypothetical protein AB0J68_29175 [Micromonospora sp. NPDC049580]|uniref:hypothetical protein n=1 Tax=Micromonospora sp. NPDC049580 TaxID=3154832 RepID=UPI003414BF8B